MATFYELVGGRGGWHGAHCRLDAEGGEFWCYRHEDWDGSDVTIGCVVTDLMSSTMRIQHVARDLGTIIHPTRPDGTPWGQWHLVTVWQTPNDTTRTGYFAKISGPGSRHRAEELAAQLVAARSWDAAERAMRVAGCPGLSILKPR